MNTELGYVVRFLLVGVLNTCVGLGTIYACKYFLTLPDIPANAVGYVAGLINSFFWNRRWTFSHAGAISKSIPRFLLTFLLAYSANLASALTLIHYFGVDAYLAHAVATVPYTVIFYFGSRYFAFSR